MSYIDRLKSESLIWAVLFTAHVLVVLFGTPSPFTWFMFGVSTALLTGKLAMLADYYEVGHKFLGLK